MSTLHNRNESIAPPPPAPPAPPLPPHNYGQRAATAIARLAQPFFSGSRPSSAQGHREAKDRRSTGLRAQVQRSSSPSSSRTAVHKTGIQILALDISPYRSHAVLAGREILKTIRVEDARCIEDFNLRSRIAAYASTHNDSRDALLAQHRDQLSAYDVKWSHGKFDTTIATAAANGRVMVYDLNCASVETARLHEHTRQVHRVAFNPHQGALLLSVSQDATIKMWDLRALGDDRSVRTCDSINTFPGNNEGIREVKWSPADGVEFAVGTDNGTVQRWDFRKESAPLMKLSAHEKICYSIDWHPSGRLLASGGADKLVKVWDFKSSDRRMKPLTQLRTPQAVRKLRWRPDAASLEDTKSQTHQSSFLATAYDGRDPRIHIWDFKRPHIPSQELDRYETPATDILWHSEDLLWSVGSAGAFTQTDLKFAPRPIERRNTNVLAAASDGTICAIFNERPRSHVLFEDAPSDRPQFTNLSGSNDDRLSSSQSANEGSLEEPNILNSSLRKRRQKLPASQLTSNTVSATVDPGTPAQNNPIMFLQATYESIQSAFIGHILGLFDPESFKYLARNYKLPPVDSLKVQDSHVHETIRYAFESNAILAENAGLYRLAQSWRIVGQAAHQDLLRRAQDTKQRRVLSPPQSTPDSPIMENDSLQDKAQPSGRITSEKTPEISLSADSFSNMSTPLVKPMTELPSFAAVPEGSLDSSGDSAVQMLRATKSAGESPGTVDFPFASSDSSPNPLSLGNSPRIVSSPDEPFTKGENNASVPFKEFADIEAEMQARRTAINNYRAKPRAILNLDTPFGATRSLSTAPQFDRHDSEESLQMFSASVDSDPRSLAISDSFEERQNIVVSRTPDAVDTSNSQSSVRHGSSFEARHPHAHMFGGIGSLSYQKGFNSRFTQPRSMSSGNVQRFPPVSRPIMPLSSKVYVRGGGFEEQSWDSLGTEFLPSDFSPPGEPQANLPPWSLGSLVSPLLDFHLEKLSDVQLPSILALYLSPLFPFLFPKLRTIAYLLSYHEQLLSLELYSQAAEFRNACQILFPPIASKVSGSGLADWYCRTCRKPVRGDDSGFCERCEQRWDACPICEESSAPYLIDPSKVKASSTHMRSNSIIGLWTWCQGCGHGGHSHCFASWFADTKTCEGTCPVVGCGHDCIAGPQREAAVARIESDRSKGRKSVMRDEWSVSESKAVEHAREMVGSEATIQERWQNRRLPRSGWT